MAINRKSYPSDLTESQWLIIEPLLPGYKTTTSKREIINGILYILRTGAPWRFLPEGFPPWRNVHDFFLRWSKKGIWEEVNDTLRESVRIRAGKKQEPSAAIIDSQSVKTTETGSGKGFDAGKKNQRHKAPYRCGHNGTFANGDYIICSSSRS